jgi:hypothetical protein
MDYMKKEIMDRFHKLEGVKVEGSKIPPQPRRKKQTAANNTFLFATKSFYSKGIYKKILMIMNEQGHEAAEKELDEIKKYI